MLLHSLHRVQGCVIATLNRGEIGVSCGGSKDATSNAAVTPDTRFEVASQTKIVTAMSALVLVAEGRIDLDEPVVARLGRWTASSALSSEVTLRQLLSHTAGMPSGVSPALPGADETPPIEDVVAGRGGMRAAVPDVAPGSQFRYSNPGYALVQLLVEDVAGTSFDEWCTERILAPLNMTHSSFQPHPDDAAPHRKARVRLPVAFSNHLGSGGLRSTAEDLLSLARALSGAASIPILPASLIAEMFSVPPGAEGAFMVRNGGYSLGVVAGRLPGGRRFLANQGSRPGFRSLLICLPESGDSLVVLTNSDNATPLLVHAALKWLLTRGRRDRP